MKGLGTNSFFLLHPGHPVPGEGSSLEQVSAVGRLLYLGPVQPAQEGEYTCECSNVAGNSSQALQLEVHGELWGDLNQAGGAEQGGRVEGQPGTLAGETPPSESTPGQQ